MEHYFEISLSILGDSDLLELVLTPENSSFPSGTIVSHKSDGRLITTISGRIGIGRVKFTIDDILKTSILALTLDSILVNE